MLVVSFNQESQKYQNCREYYLDKYSYEKFLFSEYIVDTAVTPSLKWQFDSQLVFHFV